MKGESKPESCGSCRSSKGSFLRRKRVVRSESLLLFIVNWPILFWILFWILFLTSDLIGSKLWITQISCCALASYRLSLSLSLKIILSIVFVFLFFCILSRHSNLFSWSTRLCSFLLLCLFLGFNIRIKLIFELHPPARLPNFAPQKLFRKSLSAGQCPAIRKVLILS